MAWRRWRALLSLAAVGTSAHAVPHVASLSPSGGPLDQTCATEGCAGTTADDGTAQHGGAGDAMSLLSLRRSALATAGATRLSTETARAEQSPGTEPRPRLQPTYEHLEGKRSCIAITVPHEGDRVPKRYGANRSLFKRVDGLFIRDGTKDLGRQIWRQLYKMGGGSRYPHYLRNRINRTYIDMNRPPRDCEGFNCPTTEGESAYHSGSADSKKSYDYFHAKAKEIWDVLSAKCGKGALWLDIHGQGKTPFLQVGYALSSETVENSTLLVKALGVVDKGRGGSINGLYAHAKGNGDDNKALSKRLVTGNRSFSWIMHQLRGTNSSRVWAGPSKNGLVSGIKLWEPSSWSHYFTGGFIVQRYGSCACCKGKQQQNLCNSSFFNTQCKTNRKVNALQLEFPTTQVRHSARNRRVIAAQVAQAVKNYFSVNKQRMFY